MNAETAYVGAVLLTSGFVTAVAGWLWSDDLDLSGRLFVLMVALHPPIGLLVVAEVLVPTRELSVLFYTLHTALSTGVPLAFLLFSLAFTSQRLPSRRLLTGFAAYGVVVAGLEVTNPVHYLARSEYRIVGETVPHVVGTPTTPYAILTLPTFVAYYAAMGILGYRYLSRMGGRWKQTTVLFVGLLSPFVVTGLWVTGGLPGPINGAFVMGSSWMAALAGWAVVRHHLFDVVPLAREAVFEALDERVIVVDRDHRLLDYNTSAAETFPALRGNRGDPIGDLLPALVDGGSDAGPFVSAFTAHAESDPREYTVTVSPLRAEGEVQGYAAVVRDITDRQRQIRDLERQKAQLERFASTLSHDIRNPLNVARGRSELALEDDDTAHLPEVMHALDRIDSIIDDLLTLSREGRTIDDRVRVPLAEVATDAWRTTDTRGATLRIDPDARVSVYADRTRLLNVFENLFRNSVEHGSTSNRRAEPTGNSVEHGSTESRSETGDSVEHGSTDNRRAERAGDSVEHGSTESRSETGDSVEHGSPSVVTLGRHRDGFYVEDDGPGIPPADRESVFDYEYTTADGTGMGLAIVDAIAQAHGWTTEAEEGSDGGARIVFSNVTLVDDAPGEEGDETEAAEAGI